MAFPQRKKLNGISKLEQSKMPDDMDLDVAISELEAACASHDGHAQLYRHAAARLKVLWSVLDSGKASDPASVVEDLRLTAQRLQRVLELRKFPLHWLAVSQRAVAHAHKIHERIDALYEALAVREDAQLADWRAGFRCDRLEHERWLEERLELSTDAMMFSETPSKVAQWDALVTLRNQLAAWSVNGLDGDDQETKPAEVNVSKELADLMGRTAARVFKYAEEQNEVVHAWYVPERDVLLEGGKDAEPFKKSIFEELYKGTWRNGGVREESPVIIKLFRDHGVLNNNVKLPRAITRWSMLRHENVLELLGANHLARTKFIILEYATEGSFADFFSCDDDNKKLLWGLFKQAAQGLQYLHDSDMEHRSLNTRNILVTRAGSEESAKLIVKLSGVGMAFVREETAGMSISANSRKVSDWLRWMAPELVREFEPTDPGGFRQSDMYSLGMCLWAAASGEPPYGLDDEETIVQQKFDHVPMERLDGALTDLEWELVSSMIENNPENRPSLEEAIERMGELDVLRQRDWPVKEEPIRTV